MLCWIEVDLDAVADNVRALQAAAQPRQGVTAVVKAQAYGMGAAAVAQAAVKAGARGAAVARISEARRGFHRAHPAAGWPGRRRRRRSHRTIADADARRLADHPAPRRCCGSCWP